MLGGSFFRDFGDDPLFSMQRDHMQSMQSLMQNPFGNIMHPMLTAPHVSGVPTHHHQPQYALQPFGMFGGGFSSMVPDMGNMMSNMQRQMASVQSGGHGGHGGHSFSSSTMMSYSNTGDGQPHIYQASSSTRHAPGGVREVHKAERDSRSGLEKQHVGHHIRDRGHVIERSHNHRTGDREENHNLDNLEESEAENFNREFQSHMTRHPSYQRSQHAAVEDRQRDRVRDRRDRDRDRHRHREEQHQQHRALPAPPAPSDSDKH